jgi:hypothetical protein
MKLNLGGGSKTTLLCYELVDRCVGKEVYPLEYPDGCATDVRASHVLEHFSNAESAKVLAEWVRVLAPGGEIKIAVPDMNWIFSNPTHPNVAGYLYGGQTDENDFHKTAWNETKLRAMMKSAGLVQIRRWTSELQDCAALPVSLNLCGRKPDPSKAIDPFKDISARVVGLMSAPRLQFGDTWGCINATTATYGLTVMQRKGAFWEQSLQGMFLDAIAKGYEYVFTMDYDSAFTLANFNTLYKWLAEHPDVDAVAPFQPMRGKENTILCATSNDPAQNKASIKMNEPIDAIFAHFGLTFFRLSSIEKIKLPLFHGQPGRTGLWEYADGAIDADTYFWRKFKESGLKLHVLPWVCIGHIETVISTIDKKNGGTMLVRSQDWMNQNFAPR